MALNEIIPFAGDPMALVQTQAVFDADPQRIIGNQPGIAKASFVNKAMRQSSLIAAAVAQYIADNQETNIVDTLTPAAMSALLELVIKKEAYGAVTTVNFAASPFALTAAHAGLVLVDATAGNVVLNLPAANVLAGLPYEFRRVDATANTATVNRAGADTIDEGGVSFLLAPKAPQGMRSNGVSTWSSVIPGAATLTAPGSIRIATNAEVAALTDTVKAITPASLASIFGRVLATTSGYQILASGWIIQISGVAVTKDVAVTLPIAFPTANVAVVAMHQGNNSEANPTLVGKSLSTFTLTWPDVTPSVVQSVISVGY